MNKLNDSHLESPRTVHWGNEDHGERGAKGEDSGEALLQWAARKALCLNGKTSELGSQRHPENWVQAARVYSPV